MTKLDLKPRIIINESGRPNTVGIWIDANGKRGKKGRHGVSAKIRRDGYGVDGEDGEHGRKGSNGGKIELSLSLQPKEAPATIAVTGYMQLNPDSKRLLINASFPSNSRPIIHAKAVGGNGGDGGHGGNGSPGQAGRNGIDATPASNASPGQDGGDGGNGGHGGDAGPGGDGGVVNVRVPISDLDLLLLGNQVDVKSVKGGGPGIPGESGLPGEGGPGGRGGDGIKWTTNESKTRMENRTTTDGKSSYPVYVSYTEPVYHERPPACDGLEGVQGEYGEEGLPANPGADGKFYISVLMPNGQVAEFNSAYNIEVQDFEIVSSNGVVEPGSEVTIKNIKIKNVGEMPSPSNKILYIYLTDTTESSAESWAIEIPEIGSNESLTLSGELKFKVRNYDVIPTEERFKLKYVVNMGIASLRLQTGCKLAYNKAFDVTYPVEISHTIFPNGIECGKENEGWIEVKNISESDIGQSNINNKRAAAIRIKATSKDLKAKDVNISVCGSALILEDEITIPIDELKAKSTLRIPIKISVGSDASALSDIQLATALNIGNADTPSKMKIIQTTKDKFNIVHPYIYDPKAGAVFVTSALNERTTKVNIGYLSEVLNLPISIVDTSQNVFSPTKTCHQGTGHVSDFLGKLVILELDPTSNNLNLQEIVDQACLHRVRYALLWPPLSQKDFFNKIPRTPTVNKTIETQTFHATTSVIEQILQSSQNFGWGIKIKFGIKADSPHALEARMNKYTAKLLRFVKKHHPQLDFNIIPITDSNNSGTIEIQRALSRSDKIRLFPTLHFNRSQGFDLGVSHSIIMLALIGKAELKKGTDSQHRKEFVTKLTSQLENSINKLADNLSTATEAQRNYVVSEDINATIQAIRAIDWLDFRNAISNRTVLEDNSIFRIFKVLDAVLKNHFTWIRRLTKGSARRVLTDFKDQLRLHIFGEH